MTEVTVWNGWLGGALIGLFVIAMAWIAGKPLGCSTAYGNVCGFASRLRYFHTGPYATLNNDRLWFMFGLPLGGLLAALTSPGEIVMSFSLGELYDSVLPAALPARALVLVVGGVMIGFGSRMAGGCQSGHSIMGMGLRNLPSVVASMGFFIGGIVAVQLMFGIFG